MTLHSPIVVKSQDLGGQFTGPKREIRRSPTINDTSCVTCCAVLLEPQLLDIMIVQFRNEKIRDDRSQLVFSTVRAEMAVRQLYETAFDSTASPADVDEDPADILETSRRLCSPDPSLSQRPSPASSRSSTDSVRRSPRSPALHLKKLFTPWVCVKGHKNPESPIEVTSPLNNTSNEDKSKTFSPSVEFKKLDVADETKKNLNDSHPTKINIQTTSSNDNCCNDNDVPAVIIPSTIPSHSMQYNKCFESASTSSSEKIRDGELRNGCEITNTAFDTQDDRKKIYQEPHSDFGNSRIVTYRDCGLSCRSIAARVGRDPMTVSRIWNRWFQNGNTERPAGSQRLPNTSSREDRRHVYPHGFNGSCSHVTSTESRIGVVCKTTNVCTNSSTTFETVWTLTSETMATLHAASQTGASSMV
ncbi:SH2 domain-containing adapter protein B [Trichonephila clavipes]|nr:SH2 domain-containing adapter protein B [Trichonephila clavipes]